jgi:5'(3')-deoxyribonucleotidase
MRIMKKIAIDVEGVLADSYTFVRGEVPEESMETWGFPSEEIKEQFLGRITKGWKNEAESIPLVTDHAPHATRILNSLYNVDIVTARTNADEQIISWLNDNNIHYNGFVSTKTYKERLGYDVYIDDNPHMVGEDTDLFLHDQPWNSQVNAENRVYSITEAAAQIISNDKNISRN